MWLQTRVGFFSIVEKPGDRATNRLTIRARVAADLHALRDRYLPALGDVQESCHNDYRFRATATRETVAAAIGQAVMDIDYQNFKNVVAQEQGLSRAHVYGDVWSVLHRLQESGHA
jgi:hypothetical protein